MSEKNLDISKEEYDKLLYNTLKEMKLINISGIEYEDNEVVSNNNTNYNKNTPDKIWFLRAGNKKNPTDFKQDILTRCWGSNFIDSIENVLEIGCGCGRNAQFFMNQTENVKYYGFDASRTSINFCKAQKFPENRFYVSTSIDDVILSKKYDLIFSTFVLNHIGFVGRKFQAVHDAVSISALLNFCWKVGGYWMAYESHQGQNGWEPNAWLRDSFDFSKITIKYMDKFILKGSEDVPDYNLIVFKKNAD